MLYIRFHKHLLKFIGLLLVSHYSIADVFLAHCRNRGVEMVEGNGGVCTGPVPEILETALKRIGHSVKWQNAPWARTIKGAEKGVPDILLRHSMNEERRGFLMPIVYGYEIRKLYFYVTSQRPDIEINSEQDLRNYRIGVLRDSFYAPKFSSAKDLNLSEHRELAQKVRMLESGRIDVAAIKSTQIKELREDLDAIGAKPANYVEEFFNGRYFSIPKNSRMSRHYKALSAEIYKMRKDGEISAIFEKYAADIPSQDYEHMDSKAQEALSG